MWRRTIDGERFVHRLILIIHKNANILLEILVYQHLTSISRSAVLSKTDVYLYFFM